MKISIQSSLPARRAEAETAVNDSFNREAAAHVQKDMEYRRKKEVAADVLGGDEAPAEFAEEAHLMGITVEELAAIIQAKPDTIMDRAIRRRRAVLAARSAATVEELNGILAAHSNGVTRQ